MTGGTWLCRAVRSAFLPAVQLQIMMMMMDQNLTSVIVNRPLQQPQEGPRLPPGPLCAGCFDAPRLRHFGFAALGGLHSAFYHPRDLPHNLRGAAAAQG